MKVVKILLIAGCLTGGLVSTANAQGPTPPNNVLLFETVLKLKNSGIVRPLDIVIKSEDRWCRFWSMVHRNRIPAPPCDTSLVDFTKEVVVASALGNKPNQCFDVDIVSIVESFNLPNPWGRKPSDSFVGKKWTVRVADTVAGRGAICLQAIANPVHAVKVKNQPPAKVEFIHFKRKLTWGK